MSAAGWAGKARELAKLDDAFSLLAPEEREQVDALVRSPSEPYHMVKAMIERHLADGRAREVAACQQ